MYLYVFFDEKFMDYEEIIILILFESKKWSKHENAS